MKGSLIIFLCLVGLVHPYLPPSVRKMFCEDVSAEVYCTSKERSKYCPREDDFCFYYYRTPLCERGPEEYCKNPKRAASCNKEEYCLTWPNNDYVTAVKVPPPTTRIYLLDYIQKAYAD